VQVTTVLSGKAPPHTALRKAAPGKDGAISHKSHQAPSRQRFSQCLVVLDTFYMPLQLCFVLRSVPVPHTCRMIPQGMERMQYIGIAGAAISGDMPHAYWTCNKPLIQGTFLSLCPQHAAEDAGIYTTVVKTPSGPAMCSCLRKHRSSIVLMMPV
jgi:hypothetical protein